MARASLLLLAVTLAAGPSWALDQQESRAMGQAGNARSAGFYAQTPGVSPEGASTSARASFAEDGGAGGGVRVGSASNGSAPPPAMSSGKTYSAVGDPVPAPGKNASGKAADKAKDDGGGGTDQKALLGGAAGGLIGAAIGFALGGPIGAAAGFLAGLFIGALIGKMMGQKGGGKSCGS